MEQLQFNKKTPLLLSGEFYDLKSDEIYRSTSPEYFVYLLRRSVIFYCSKKYEDPDDDTVTYFTCNNLLRFINEKFERRKFK